MSTKTKAIGAVGVVAAAAAVGGRGAIESALIASSGPALHTAATAAVGGKGAIESALIASSGPALHTAATHTFELGTEAAIDSSKVIFLSGQSNHIGPTIARNGPTIARNNDRLSNLDLITKSRLNGQTQFPVLNQRPIIAIINQEVIDPNSHKFSALFEQAEPKILGDLDANVGRLTQSEIREIVRKELTKTAEKAASQPHSGFTFEALSGKLTIDSSRTIFGITLTGGEVNVYKISTTLASGVVACEALAAPRLKKCAEAALAKVGSAVAKELTPTNNSKEGSDK